MIHEPSSASSGFLRLVPLLALVVLSSAPVGAVDEDRKPVEIDKTETAEVRLVLLDTLVVDRQGTPVPGLQREAFTLTAGGDLIEIDTFDVDCAVRPPGERDARPRRMALVFDYQHLPPVERELALESAQRLIKTGETGADEVMVAALTGGLRIEQGFTHDREALEQSLKRMRYDVSLWNGNYVHQSERGFVESLETLFTILGRDPGPKAMVLYSGIQDVPLDMEFERLAAMAATHRTSIYPVDCEGLTTDSMVPATGPG